MGRKFYNLVLRSEGDMNARAILEDSFQRDSEAINSLTSLLEDTTSTTRSSTTEIDMSMEPAIKDPSYTKTKGRSKRAKSAIERKTTKSSEFGSKTPNPRLF